MTFPHLKEADVIDDIKEHEDYYFNTIFCDPPYNLSSQWVFEGDRPVMRQAKDFMGKWSFNHDQWQEYFAQAMRVLKYGGYCIMFGMDRQLWPMQYYAQRAGFEITQSLYWYFCSSFPKSTDASKQIDKRLGEERNVIGQKQSGKVLAYNGLNQRPWHGKAVDGLITYDVTESSSELAKTFNGYKYSVAPFKQVVETIMVFRKPTKNKSVLDDLFAWSENQETLSKIKAELKKKTSESIEWN